MGARANSESATATTRARQGGGPILRLLACTLAVLAITGVPFAIHAGNERPLSAVLDLFLIVILAASIRWGAGYAIYLSLLSTLAFSLTLPPAGHFHFNDSRVWTLMAACLVTGLVASQLSGLARRETLAATQREAEALAAQQRFSDLVNSVEGIVWEADADTFAFSFVSDQAERVLGYPPKRWLSEPTFWPDLVHSEDRDMAVKFRREAVAGKRNYDFEYRMIAADGRTVWIRDLVTIVLVGGQAKHLRGVMVDVTKRKQNEEALREQANLLNLAHDAIVVRDMNRVIQYWNRGAEELYGWTAEDAVGRLLYDPLETVFQVPLEQIEKEVVRAGRWEGELVHKRKNGTRIVVASRWSLQRDERGAPVAILVTSNDITEQKRAEQEQEKRRELEAELAHINRVSTLGELAASLAHELNQPITAAITNANTVMRWLAREQPDVQEAREATMRMVKDGTRAAEIINRMRSFYKKGGQDQRELVDMNEVVSEMMGLLQNEASRRTIAMRTDLAPELPKVMADRVQLQQVLMNLMLNSIEAMQGKAGELCIKSELASTGELLVSVSDTGVGLPADGAGDIFKAFVTTKPQGTGMGLAITRSLIEAHGGRLWATANTHRGATFHFTLPREQGAHA